MICNQTTGCNCLKCRPTQELIYRPEFIPTKESEFVQVKKEDLLFLIEQTRLEENYIEHEKISNIREKYLVEKGN